MVEKFECVQTPTRPPSIRVGGPDWGVDVKFGHKVSGYLLNILGSDPTFWDPRGGHFSRFRGGLEKSKKCENWTPQKWGFGGVGRGSVFTFF